MTWQRIDERHLARSDPNGPAVLYWDSRPLGGGSLLLWLGAEGQVLGFQLAYAPFPPGREYLAHWCAGRRLRIGEVDSGESGVEGGPRRKMSPIVRGSVRPPDAVLVVLLGYFEREGTILEPQQHAAVSSVLYEAIRA